MTDKQKEMLTMVINRGRAWMTPEEAATIIGCAPQAVRDACRDGTAGYNASVQRARVRIPVLSFLEFWGFPLSDEQKLKFIINAYQGDEFIREYADAIRETRGAK